MLKNTRSHRKVATYTVIIDQPVHAERPTPAEIFNATHEQANNARSVMASLGHDTEDLLAALKHGVVAVRFLVHVKDVEAAAELHDRMSEALSADTTIRMVYGDSLLGLQDYALMRVA